MAPAQSARDVVERQGSRGHCRGGSARRRVELCRQRREALSPYTVPGEHMSHAGLPKEALEAIHRLKTDASRITEKWVRETVDGVLGEERYVEIVSIVAIMTALDTFDHALGRSLRALPAPLAGAPRAPAPIGCQTRPCLGSHPGA